MTTKRTVSATIPLPFDIVHACYVDEEFWAVEGAGRREITFAEAADGWIDVNVVTVRENTGRDAEGNERTGTTTVTQRNRVSPMTNGTFQMTGEVELPGGIGEVSFTTDLASAGENQTQAKMAYSVSIRVKLVGRMLEKKLADEMTGSLDKDVARMVALAGGPR